MFISSVEVFFFSAPPNLCLRELDRLLAGAAGVAVIQHPAKNAGANFEIKIILSGE